MAEKKIKLGVFGILERDGRFLMGLRSADDPSFPNQWCHPGGGVEWGESLDAALRREFLEEVVMEVSVSPDYLAVHEYFTAERHVVLVFKQGFSQQWPHPGDGFSEVGWFSFKEILEMSLAGKTTPLTITAATAFNATPGGSR